MGIPSYFSYIIKNYNNIIQNPAHVLSNLKFTSLYMDCNSIIYDVVHAIESEPPLSESLTLNEVEDHIIMRVILQIETYISFISPTGTVFIAFDGVAPMAKMEQQRTRRSKAAFMESIDFDGGTSHIKINSSNKFSTTAITPGTHFMQKLSDATKSYFENRRHHIVSASDVVGEGENKMFQHLRDYCTKDDVIAVYGLDADLIMLSLFHCDLCSNIFIYREAPAFAGSYIHIDPNCKIYLMDILKLSGAIIQEMNVKNSSKNLIQDYMFLCFILGNDFMPHFPALNIRTHGIQILLDLYRNIIGKFANRRLICNKKIVWKYVALLFEELAILERGLIIQEYAVREKFNRFRVSDSTRKDRMDAVDNTPILYRGDELFIAPKNYWWENRYYETLFKLKRVEPVIKDICINYLEGLEWTFSYYVSGCKSWRWKYNYDYPPLLCDLTRYVPKLDTIFIENDESQPVPPEVQLAYVLPESMQYLLSQRMRNAINDPITGYNKKLYPKSYIFKWSFCRYLWESHLELPDVDDSVIDALTIISLS